MYRGLIMEMRTDFQGPSNPDNESIDRLISKDTLLVQELSSIPNKLGFKIGEVAELLGIKQYVLRFWETEFEQLRPSKAGNNHRYYTRKEVELAFVIRKLLHRDQFSIPGAKNILKQTSTMARQEAHQAKKANDFQHQMKLAQGHLSELIQEIQNFKKKCSDL